MLTKNQERILNLFRRNILLKSTIRQISLNLKKSYSKIHAAVKELEKKNIIIIRKVGKSSVCEIKLSPEIISIFSFLDEQEARERSLPNYEKLLSLREVSDYLIIVAGSYAKRTQNKKSDMDLVVIVPDKENIVNVKGLIENLTMLYLPEIHLYVFKRKDFIDMLNEKEENYGKEIFKNHIILKNAYVYYELIKEAIEHGFKG